MTSLFAIYSVNPLYSQSTPNELVVLLAFVNFPHFLLPSEILFALILLQTKDIWSL